MKKHIRTIHSEKHLKCDKCETMVSTIGTLNKHKMVVHVLNSFKCHQCTFRFKTKSHLNVHIKGVHAVGANSAKCDMCDFQGTIRSLKPHKESIHESKKNWF